MGLPVQSTARVGASCLGVLLTVLATSGPVAAASRPITGALSKQGYTVIALAQNGKAKAVRASPRRFRLTPPGRSVTLHLRTAKGAYAGPIVVGGRGRLAIVGIRAGANLPTIRVRRGYARVTRKLPTRWLDAKRKARARKGVPIGAKRFGRVRSKPPRGGAPGDRDLDGIPDVLDIDDDGDLVLDNLERGGTVALAPATGAAQAPAELFDVLTSLSLELERTTNANAAPPGSPLTVDQIDAALASSGRLLMKIMPGDSPELDCGGSPNESPPPPLVGGLVYCSAGGTGRIFRGGALPFPDCCDSEDPPDGFGSLTPDPTSPPPPATPFFFLGHGAGTDQIGTGDLLIQRVSRGGVETAFPTALQFVFATVPALASYSDTAGNSVTVSYPVATDGLGTMGNGFPVAAGADGKVILTLTFWRPQREPIPPEPGPWTDIGGLTYSTVVQHLGTPPAGTTVQQPCPQSSYSATPDQPLAPPEAGGPGLTDQRGDQPASAGNKLTYTLDLTHCLTSLGVSWSAGEASIHFGADVSRPGVGAGASQTAWFKLP
jgi:hypothetical protein